MNIDLHQASDGWSIEISEYRGLSLATALKIANSLLADHGPGARLRLHYMNGRVETFDNQEGTLSQFEDATEADPPNAQPLADP